MKKTYFNPEIEIMEIKTPTIMAGSAARFDGSGGGEVNLDPTNPDDGAAMGRDDGYDW